MEVERIFKQAFRSQHPKMTCIASLICTIIAAVIVYFIFTNINWSQSSADSTAQTDTALILDLVGGSFSDTLEYSVTYDASSNPDTYGAMLYIENGFSGSYGAELKYNIPNTDLNISCGSSGVSGNYPVLIFCDIHPQFIVDATKFYIVLSNCVISLGSCYASLSFAYLSVLPLSSDTKYDIQISFNMANLYAIGISRYHYFKLNQNGMSSLKLSLKDEDQSYLSDCDYMCVYERCIYVDTNNSFPDRDNYQWGNCEYECHNEGDYGGSYYLETLSINTNSKISDYFISVYVDGGSIDSTDLQVDGTNPQLYVQENVEFSVYLWIYFIVIGVIFIVLMIPSTYFCYKGLWKPKYRIWVENKRKQKFFNAWQAFYMNRYDMLLKLFVEKGIVDLIQMYLDDLEVFPNLNDENTFRTWYCKKNPLARAFHMELKRPLLLNTQ